MSLLEELSKNSLQTYYCDNKCCNIYIQYYSNKRSYVKPIRNYRKAGVFIFDPKEDRVLLVQSRGHLFGPPKGSLKTGETETECAVREVKEETGIDVNPGNFLRAINIKNNAIYYYMEMDMCDNKGYIQNQIFQGESDNDANGITWIKIDCLEKAILSGNIVLNHYAKIVFYRLFRKVFPKSNWTLVERKYKKRGVIDRVYK